MHLEVYGGTKTRRRQIFSIVEFCALELLTVHRRKTLYLEVSLECNLLKNDNLHGCVEIWEGSPLPEGFLIRIDSQQNRMEMLRTACHEMVHVRQYAHGQLQELCRKPFYRFKNRLYEHALEYDKQPWEQEATKLQDELYFKWLHDAPGAPRSFLKF